MRKIETARLILRPLTPADAADVFEWVGDPLVNRYMPYALYTSVAEAEAWIRRIEPEDCEFGFELAATGKTAAVSQYATREEVDNSGWCVSTVEAALWALNTTASFEDALVAAVNLGGDADSIGAVCGQLAGAKYGVGAIPERWLAAIKDGEKLADLFDRFLAALDNAPVAP